MTRFFPLPAFCMFAILLVPSTSFAAETNPDRFQMNHDIHIQADEKVGDVTCIGCSVYVRGQVSGDVTAIAGSVIAESGASIAGDVTTIGGNARVENGTQVAGDLTAIGGDVRRDPQASVAGDVTTMGGHGWVFPDLPAALRRPRRHHRADHLADPAQPPPRPGSRLHSPPELSRWWLCGAGAPARMPGGSERAQTSSITEFQMPAESAGEGARATRSPLTLRTPARRSPAPSRTSHPTHSPALPETRAPESAPSASP